MTGLIAVADHLPATVPVAQLQASLGMTDGQVRRFTRLYGLAEICQAPEQTEAQLLRLAAEGLGDALAANRHRIRYVIRACGLRSTAPYPHSPVRDVAAELGLVNAVVMSVADHGCATGLVALDLAHPMAL